MLVMKDERLEGGSALSQVRHLDLIVGLRFCEAFQKTVGPDMGTKTIYDVTRSKSAVTLHKILLYFVNMLPVDYVCFMAALIASLARDYHRQVRIG
jgi:hypothetical protein